MFLERKMRALLFAVIFMALAVLINAATPYVCYASDGDPYLQFATKTAYDFSAGRQGGRGDERGIPGCRPLQVWMVARHGARNPSAAEIERFGQVVKLKDEIVRNYEEARSKCKFFIMQIKIKLF
jgi:hypothetical protein